MSQFKLKTARFALGQCVATPGALEALAENQTHAIVFLRRHAEGDWGTLSADDIAMNEAALTDESRIFSAYILADGRKIWVITEAVNEETNQRDSTCILLPSEY